MGYAKKMTHEDFLEKFRDTRDDCDEYEFLEKYQKSTMKIKTKHTTCGHVWGANPTNLTSSKTKCPKCSNRIKKTQDSFEKEIYQLVGDEYIILSEYINAKTKVKIKHNCADCDFYEFLVSPNDFLSVKKSRCTNKVHRKPQPKKKSTEMFKKEVFELSGEEYEVVGDYVSAHVKIDILHKKCGYLWNVTPHGFLRGSRCLNCNKNHFVLRDFRNKIKNKYCDEYIILDYIQKDYKVQVEHSCGKVYKITPSLLLKGIRCSDCFGGIKLTNEQFLKKLKDKCGDDFIPLDEYNTAITKMRFFHKKCEREFVATSNAIFSGNGCSFCAQSKGERRIVSLLDSVGVEYISEYRDERCRHKYTLPFDLAVIKDGDIRLLIEYDGQQHFDKNHFKGDSKTFKKIQLRDGIKNKFCLDNEIPLLRIPYWDFDSIEHIVFDELVELDILEEVLI